MPIDQRVAYGEYEGKDPSAQAIIDDVSEWIQQELGVVLAATPFEQMNDRPGWVNEEMNLAALVCDALVYDAEQSTGTSVDGAVFNMGALRTPLEEGDITLEDAKTVMSFSNMVCTILIGGANCSRR